MVSFLTDVFLEFEMRRDKKKNTKDTKTSTASSCSVDVNIKSLEGAEDKYKPQDYPPPMFAGCYSDTESEEEDRSVKSCFGLIINC